MTDPLAPPNQPFIDQFSAFEDDGVTKRSGLTLGAGDFEVVVYLDAVIQNQPPINFSDYTITEASAGEYKLSFTPNALGLWVVDVTVVFNEDIFRTSIRVGSLAAVVDPPEVLTQHELVPAVVGSAQSTVQSPTVVAARVELPVILGAEESPSLGAPGTPSLVGGSELVPTIRKAEET